MNRRVVKALEMPKFKHRIRVVWWSPSYICIRDILTGQAKLIKLNKGAVK